MAIRRPAARGPGGRLNWRGGMLAQLQSVGWKVRRVGFRASRSDGRYGEVYKLVQTYGQVDPRYPSLYCACVRKDLPAWAGSTGTRLLRKRYGHADGESCLWDKTCRQNNEVMKDCFNLMQCSCRLIIRPEYGSSRFPVRPHTHGNSPGAGGSGCNCTSSYRSVERCVVPTSFPCL